MTVKDFRKTMLQIDQIVWVDNATQKEIDFPREDWEIVDAYFSAVGVCVRCAVFIKSNK